MYKPVLDIARLTIVNILQNVEESNSSFEWEKIYGRQKDYGQLKFKQIECFKCLKNMIDEKSADSVIFLWESNRRFHREQKVFKSLFSCEC